MGVDATILRALGGVVLSVLVALLHVHSSIKTLPADPSISLQTFGDDRLIWSHQPELVQEAWVASNKWEADNSWALHVDNSESFTSGRVG
eukprot:1923225-Amphidinium_carterae.1